VIAAPEGPKCLATQAVAEEIARHVPRLAAKRGLDEKLLLAALQAMPIIWKATTDYEGHRDDAQRRVAGRDPDDWPTVALALELDTPVWSQDKDLGVTGLRVYTTGELLDALRESGEGASEAG